MIKYHWWVKKMKRKNKFTLTKGFTFDCAHRLDDYDGACAKLHGHTYRLEVSICGDKHENGLVYDFHEIKSIVQDRIISVFDHNCLNDILDFNPTAENVCEWIWNTLEPIFIEKGCSIEEIALWETPTSCCNLTREKE